MGLGFARLGPVGNGHGGLGILVMIETGTVLVTIGIQDPAAMSHSQDVGV